ncbi:hypothetical protein NB693_21325 [Pantoea ananatis]|uniref:hypothetical protein n=1 Tax=Pantoea ananas TaxID=553 RepID=UPI00221EF83C|nr:hypothetical protein [Pantoea ananatis]
MAILEYLGVRGLAQLIACDIHPLNNLRVAQFFEDAGFDALEQFWYNARRRRARGPLGGRCCHPSPHR